MSFFSCQQKEKPSHAKNDLVGVYKYIDGREGLSIITDQYFIFSGKWKHEPLPLDSEDYYEKEYKSLFLEAGTYTLEDTIVRCSQFFGKEPYTDNAFRFSYSFRGDTMMFHILNKNDEIVGKGTTLKLKQSNGPNDLTGTYKTFDGADFEAISVLTEDYFIFAGRYNNRFSMVDSTNPYMNKYKSLFYQAGTYTMQGSIVTSNLLYAKNPSAVGTSYRWSYSFTGDTIATGFVNEDDKVTNWSDYSIRLE